MVYFQRGRFRNSGSGPMRLLNLGVAAGVGVISGQYIFKEPLEEYWAERAAEEAAGGGQPTAGNSSGETSSTAAAPASK